MVTREIGGLKQGAKAGQAVHRAAEALRYLHVLPQRIDRLHTIRDELSTVVRWSQPIMHRRPQLAEQYDDLVENLARASQRISDGGFTVVHKDYYADQLVYTSDAVWITDLDTLAMGHPEVDVATCAAHSALDALLTQVWRKNKQDANTDAYAQSLAAASMAELVKAYRDNGGHIDDRRLGFYSASAFARLGAIHAFRELDDSHVSILWLSASNQLAYMN